MSSYVQELTGREQSKAPNEVCMVARQHIHTTATFTCLLRHHLLQLLTTAVVTGEPHTLSDSNLVIITSTARSSYNINKHCRESKKLKRISL